MNLEKLILARAVIEDPENWTRRAVARNEHGKEVLPHSPRAVCWCAMGACLVAGYNTSGALIGILSDEHPRETLPSFNDDERRSHADILNLFDRAIDKLL